LAPEQLSRVQDFEKRITDFAAGLEAQGIPKDQQEFQALQQFGPEMAELARDLGGNVPGWFREFAGKARTAYQDQSYGDALLRRTGPLGLHRGSDPFGFPGGGSPNDPFGPGGYGGRGPSYNPYDASNRGFPYPFLEGEDGPYYGSPEFDPWDYFPGIIPFGPGRGGGGSNQPGGQPGGQEVPNPNDPSQAPRNQIADLIARYGPSALSLLPWLFGGGGDQGGGGDGGFNLGNFGGGPLGNLNALFSSSAIPNNYDDFFRQLTGQSVPGNTFGNQLNDTLPGLLGGGRYQHLAEPNIISQFLPRGGTITDHLGQSTQVPGAQPGQVLPFLQRQLGSLQETGLPGQRLLQEPGGPLSFLEMLQGSSGLLNTGQGGGLIPGLQHILDQGLPGQQQIEGLVPGQLGVGGQAQGVALAGLGQPVDIQTPGIQGTVEDSLRSLIQGGGLSDEFVRAQTERVLEPALKRFEGQQIAQLGGRGSLQSGQSQDRRRDLISDFNNDLIRQGFQNLQGFQGQGVQLGANQFGQGLGQNQLDIQRLMAQGGMGQQAFANALGAFGAVPQNAAPFLDIASQLQGSLGGQALGRFNTLSGQGLNALNTFGSLGQIPFQQSQDIFGNQLAAMQLGLGRERFLGDFAQNNVNSGINFVNSLLGNQTQRQGLDDAVSASRFNTLFQGGALIANPFIEWLLNRNGR
jgi:hypothetical protein